MSRLAELQQKMKDLQDTFKKEGQVAFQAAVQEIFERYPTVEGFKWTQYTPYFNDGDTCEFQVYNDVEIKSEFGHFKDQYGKPGWTKTEAAAAKEFAACLSPDDLMLALFGDHAEIQCYRDRIEVSEYSHD